jgi:AcrR family transcriptional regulator
MKKQPEITAATRKAFVDAFCSLYAHTPIEKITIQEITNKAGYNRSTFYQYFKDANDLLSYLEDEIISHVKDAVISHLERVDFEDAFIISFTEMQKGMETYAEALLGNQNSTKSAERIKSAMMPVIMQHFSICEHDINAMYVLEFYLSGVISIASRWLRCGRETPVEELGGLIRSLLTAGVLSTLNHKITPLP